MIVIVVVGLSVSTKFININRNDVYYLLHRSYTSIYIKK